MPNSTTSLYYDPYQVDFWKNPYPLYERMRREAPVYYNPEHDFFAVTLNEDVREGLINSDAFISGRSDILELIKADVQMPPGTFIFMDAPSHMVYRTLAQRFFAPRRMRELEIGIRKITQQCLDKLVGRDEFDIIADIGAQIPMRIIGTMLGIPEQDFEKVREGVDARLITDAGKPIDYDGEFSMDESFQQYIDWRAENPGDDVITELLNTEFIDENKVTRHLTKEEILSFVNVLAGAGNETTNKLIGWMGKLFAEHPDQRQQLVDNPALIPQAIEEVLRFEPTGHHIARYVAKDTEIRGVKIHQGSAVLFIVASANRDESKFDRPDRFDIHRKSPHITFGAGPHTCIGNALARLEARIVLEEWLKRIPTWNVDMDHARLLSTSTVRGWETLPAYINQQGAQAIASRAKALLEAESLTVNRTPESIAGSWIITIKSPTGSEQTELHVTQNEHGLSAIQTGDGTTTQVTDITYKNGQLEWLNQTQKPFKMKLKFTAAVNGDTFEGKVKVGFIGSFPLRGEKQKV